MIGVSLPKLAVVTMAAFKTLNTLAVALRQANSEVSLAETPNTAWGFLGGSLVRLR